MLAAHRCEEFRHSLLSAQAPKEWLSIAGAVFCITKIALDWYHFTRYCGILLGALTVAARMHGYCCHGVSIAELLRGCDGHVGTRAQCAKQLCWCCSMWVHVGVADAFGACNQAVMAVQRALQCTIVLVGTTARMHCNCQFCIDVVTTTFVVLHDRNHQLALQSLYAPCKLAAHGQGVLLLAVLAPALLQQQCTSCLCLTTASLQLA